MLKQSITNFLQNKSYNINISKNRLYINNYTKIDTVNEKNIKILIDDIKMYIEGEDLKVIKLLNNEVLFKGKIESINFK